MKTLIFAVTIIFACNLMAADTAPPSFVVLMEDGQSNSALTIACNSIDQKTIECDFTQKRITNIKPDIIPNDESLKQGIAQFSKLCSSSDIPNPVNAYDHKEMGIFMESCSCIEKKGSDKISCLKGYLKERSTIIAETCKISANNFTHVLKKVSPGKWMRVNEPSGLCSIVNSIVIEKIGKYDWKYTQIRLSIDKKVEACKAFDENVPLIYRSDLPKIDTLPCKYIDMSKPF